MGKLSFSRTIFSEKFIIALRSYELRTNPLVEKKKMWRQADDTTLPDGQGKKSSDVI